MGVSLGRGIKEISSRLDEIDRLTEEGIPCSCFEEDEALHKNCITARKFYQEQAIVCENRGKHKISARFLEMKFLTMRLEKILEISMEEGKNDSL